MIAAYEKEGPGLKPLVFAGFFARLKPALSPKKQNADFSELGLVEPGVVDRRATGPGVATHN